MSGHAENPAGLEDVIQRAQAHLGLGNAGAARQLLSPLVEAGLADPRPFNLLAMIEFKLGHFEQSARLLESSLTLEPMQAETQMRLGIVQGRLEKPKIALSCYDRSIELDASRPETYYNRGSLLQSMRRFEAALADFDAALALDKGYAKSAFSKALLLQFLGRFAMARDAFDLALKQDPTNADLQFAKAELLLTLGDYPQGWALFEWRWKSRFRSPLRPPRRAQAWRGDQPLGGKSIAILNEGGFGDYLMFARYVEKLKTAGAAITLQAEPALHGLLRSLGEAVQLLGPDEALPRTDFYCPLMSLPLAFGTTMETVPSTFPYLRVPADKQSLWRDRLGERSKPRVGVAWSGRKGRKIDEHPLRRRDVPLDTIVSLLDLPFDFHVLQKDIDPGDRGKLMALPQVKLHNAEIGDFSDTAALADLMDLVITIDTSTAHLAGALGKPFWLLTAFAPDYRWMATGETTPWYPSARLFRQIFEGGWAPVVGQIRQALLAMWPAR